MAQLIQERTYFIIKWWCVLTVTEDSQELALNLHNVITLDGLHSLQSVKVNMGNLRIITVFAAGGGKIGTGF